MFIPVALIMEAQLTLETEGCFLKHFLCAVIKLKVSSHQTDTEV